ncbi:hypothetical protein K439DRAFT_1634876 [Ramaria rubella]|nr:hypothetical protein K439DRAFT_1634876 [Ramaria rubella]
MWLLCLVQCSCNRVGGRRKRMQSYLSKNEDVGSNEKSTLLTRPSRMLLLQLEPAIFSLLLAGQHSRKSRSYYFGL